jgi:thioredoxin 1
MIKGNTWLDKMVEPLPPIIKDNLFVILILFMWVVKTYFNTLTPIKEMEGSLVHTIKSEDEWNEAVTKALEDDKIIVVDFYANWCPPCKAAAPVYSRLSIECKGKPVSFWKVDVDSVSSVVSNQNIAAFPTFRIYTKHVGNSGIPALAQLDTMQGWKGEDAFREFVGKQLHYQEHKNGKIESEKSNAPKDIKDKKSD